MKTLIAIELIDPAKTCIRSGQKPNVILKFPDVEYNHSTKDELFDKIMDMLTDFGVLINMMTKDLSDTTEVIVSGSYVAEDSYDAEGSFSIFKRVEDMFEIPNRLREDNE